MPPRNLSFPPMEAELITELPDGDDWQYEPKWDGLITGERMAPPCAPSFFAAILTTSSVASGGKAALRRQTPLEILTS